MKQNKKKKVANMIMPFLCCVAMGSGCVSVTHYNGVMKGQGKIVYLETMKVETMKAEEFATWKCNHQADTLDCTPLKVDTAETQYSPKGNK